MQKRASVTCATAAASLVAFAPGGVANAAVTTVQGGGLGGSEPSVWNVLNALIPGANLNQAQINTAGPIGAVAGLSRVDDDFDRLFIDGQVPVSVLGLFFSNPDIGQPFAGDEHDLYFENETAGGFATQVADFTNVLGPISVGPGETFSLTAVRDNLFFDGTQDVSKRAIASSIPSENVADGDTSQDRMVTFQIDISQIGTLNGLDGQTIDLSQLSPVGGSGLAYVHFFDTGSDADYQDAVYLTLGARNVPTPGAAALLCLAGAAGVRRRRG